MVVEIKIVGLYNYGGKKDKLSYVKLPFDLFNVFFFLN